MMIRKWLAIGFLISGGVILAVTPLRSADDPKPAVQQNPPEPPPKIVIRIYDIRTLISPPDDFPLESARHADAFITPPTLQGAGSGYGGEAAGGGGGGASLFGGQGRRPGPTREESISLLVKTITDFVSTDSWSDAGGVWGSIREINGMLIVRQTEEAHKQIATLLKQLSDLHNQPIRTTAEWLLLTPAELENLMKPSGRDSGAPREVDAAALTKVPASVRQIHAELPGHNGQTLHFLSGHEKSVTINAIATVGTGVAAYSPQIGIVADGVGFEVTAVVDFERKNAVLTIFSTFNDAQEQGPTMTMRTFATTQPSSSEPISGSTASATYHEVGSIVQEFRSTLRIPLNTPVLAGAMTLTPTARESDGRELVLIVCVHAGE